MRAKSCQAGSSWQSGSSPLWKTFAFVTSNHSPEVVEQSKQAGAIACLAKPLDVQQVLELFRIPLALGTKK